MRSIFLSVLLILPFAVRGINPESLSQTEVNAWQAYYHREYSELFANMRKIFELQFGLSTFQAAEIANYYATAATLFGSLPHDASKSEYQAVVLPCLTKAYAVLNSYAPMADYESAAQFDLEWWINRRDPATNGPATIGSSMAKMYAAINDQINREDLERAAYLRAVAGQYRDLSQGKWGGMTAQDWMIVHQILSMGYQILCSDSK